MIRHNKFVHFGFFLVGVAAFGAVTMLLWNWLFPALFGLQSISFWQALGLLVLTRLLFGFGKMGAWGRKHDMKSKWRDMSTEDRNNFFQKLKYKHHCNHPEDQNEQKKQPAQ